MSLNSCLYVAGGEAGCSAGDVGCIGVVGSIVQIVGFNAIGFLPQAKFRACIITNKVNRAVVETGAIGIHVCVVDLVVSLENVSCTGVDEDMLTRKRCDGVNIKHPR